ncbi:clavesin-1-like [Battus philenor]|uniref:clavesin-1-like n=1 Tax=Battus philenor TaxID=42288 RepID=UPI0035CEE7C0
MHLQEHQMFLYTEEDKQAEKKAIGLKDSVLEEDVDATLEWVKTQPHLSEALIERHIVEKFLIAGKGYREKTKKRLDNFYKHRCLSFELIQSRIAALSNPNIKMWSFFRQAVIPKLYNGKRIIAIAFSPDASALDTEIMYRNFILTFDMRLRYDYMFSDIWILDLNGTGLSHLLRLNPVLLQKVVAMYQESIGIHVKQIHCVNAPIFGHHVVNFMKKFVKPKLIDRIIIHETCESLQQHVPKEYLPKDFGGEQPSLMEFTEQLEREVRSEKTKSVLIDYCKLVSDESKRPREEYDEECIVGSFKKLDFD